MKHSFDKKFNFFQLIRFALPSVIMMMFMSVYTIVDGIFVSIYVGTDALSSINIILPLYSLIIAVGIMFGTGGTALVSKQLGEGKLTLARSTFSLITLTASVASVILALVIYAFNEPIFRLLGADDTLLGYCQDYFLVNLIFTIPLMLQTVFQNFMVAAGKPGLGFTLTVAAGVSNMVFDYVFIVICDMGIAGAAYATGLGNCLAGVGMLIFFVANRKGLRLALPVFKIKYILKSCSNGSSEMVSNISNSVIVLAFNLYMMKSIGSDGVAAVSIICYAQFLINSLYIGFGIGVAPLIGYNYGARDTDNLKSILKKCYVFIVVSSILLFIIAFFTSDPLSAIFSPRGTKVHELASNGLKLFSIGFIFSGFNIFSSAQYTALSNGKISALISFSRTLFFSLLSLLLLSWLFGTTGLWLSIPVAEFVTLCLAVTITAVKSKKQTLFI